MGGPATEGNQAAEQEGTLLLLDGYSLLYRAFYALPAESFSVGDQHTNAVYGFTSMLINMMRDESPTHVAVAFDVGKRTFRTESYPQYKAGRSATPPEFSGQAELVREVLAALGIPVVSKENFEADDVIATLATRAGSAGLRVLISTGDRDAFQLITETSSVLWPKKGVSDLVRMTPAEVEAKYAVTPERYPDLAALVGESADNLPGVPGVGPKTAAKWLNLYQDLEGLLDHAHELPGKVGASLREHVDQVRRNRHLNRLVTDLELDVDVPDLARRAWDREAVERVFRKLEFKTLLSRLESALPDSEAAGGGGGEDGTAGAEPAGADADALSLPVHTLNGAEAEEWLRVHGAGTLGVSVLGQWGQGSGSVSAVALATTSEAACFELSALSDDARRALQGWFAGPSTKVLHEAKGPLHALREVGMPLGGGLEDSVLAAYLCASDARAYDLHDLLRRYAGREIRGEHEPIERLGLEAVATLELMDALRTEVRARGGEGLLEEIELPLVKVLADMEARGIALDPEQLARLDEDFSERIELAAAAAYRVLGREVNLGSPKQIQVALFTELGLPETKKTKTGLSTDAEALGDLHRRTGHPFLEHLLEHRDAVKLRQSVEGLRRSMGDDGRVHTTYQQAAAATGRLSSTDPNLQNIPIRTEAGRRIREAFVVGDGYESLLTADYSQIEMRLMAHLSGDSGLIEAFSTGEDLHRFVGSRVFSVAPEEVDPEMRAKVKAMSYGLAYGLSAFGLARQLNITNGEAKELMAEYFTRFGGVQSYLQGVVEVARSKGYTETLLGRRRYFPDLVSSNRQLRTMAERAALNAPVQGSAADVIKLAMLKVEESLRDEELGSRMLLQIHDELLVEVAPGEEEVVEALVRREMGNALELAVPLEVSVGVGRSWHDAGH